MHTDNIQPKSQVETNGIFPTSWQTYRELFELASRPQGCETAGITQEEFTDVIQDSRTVFLPYQDMYIPLATPVDNLEWYNMQYFQKAMESSGLDSAAPVWYYEHHETLYSNDPESYVSCLKPIFDELSEQGGLLTFDHLDSETAEIETSMGAILSASNYSARDILPTYDPEAKHYNHAAEVALADPADVKKEPLDFAEAYNLGKLGGMFPDGISVELIIDHADRQQVWDFYIRAFDELTSEDPIKASSSYDEFIMLLENPDVLKIVERSAETVTAVCMFGDVRVFPWVNQQFYRQSYHETYERGHIFFFPGVIRNPEAGGNGRRVMAPMGRLLALAGIERSILSFVCDKTSEKPVTTIGNWALNRSGVITDVRQRVSERLFRALALNR